MKVRRVLEREHHPGVAHLRVHHRQPTHLAARAEEGVQAIQQREQAPRQRSRPGVGLRDQPDPGSR
jgi:hypothetical protein